MHLHTLEECSDAQQQQRVQKATPTLQKVTCAATFRNTESSVTGLVDCSCSS
jgi:hypothetical protein